MAMMMYSIILLSLTLHMTLVAFFFFDCFAQIEQAESQTWRLFIAPVSGADFDSITHAALVIALEKRLRIPQTVIKLVISRERDRYCATLSLRAGAWRFPTERKVTLELDQEGGKKALVE